MSHRTLEQRRRAADLHQRRGFGWLELGRHNSKVAILMHGITGGKDDMLVLAERFVERGYHVYCPDLPGHGDTQAIELEAFSDLGKWLQRFFHEIAVVPDLIVGDSYASAVIYAYMQLGFLPPYTRVMLTCPTPRVAWISHALHAVSQRLPVQWTWRAYNIPLAQKIRIWWMYRGDTEESYKWLVESEARKLGTITPTTSPHMSDVLFRDNPFDGPQLPVDVQRRITVVIGEKDNIITREGREYMRQILSDARFVTAKHAGHTLHFEAIDTIVAADKA